LTRCNSSGSFPSSTIPFGFQRGGHAIARKSFRDSDHRNAAAEATWRRRNRNRHKVWIVQFAREGREISLMRPRSGRQSFFDARGFGCTSSFVD